MKERLYLYLLVLLLKYLLFYQLFIYFGNVLGNYLRICWWNYCLLLNYKIVINLRGYEWTYVILYYSCVVWIIDKALKVILLIALILLLRHHIISWIWTFVFWPFLSRTSKTPWFIRRDAVISSHFAARLSFNWLKLCNFGLI